MQNSTYFLCTCIKNFQMNGYGYQKVYFEYCFNVMNAFHNIVSISMILLKLLRLQMCDVTRVFFS